MTTKTYTLTYPQLMNQALRKGLGPDELVRLRKAYETAAQLMDGLYRPQHVPFICHLVRTASILLEEGASFDVVLVGLLHAAYTNGCFEDQKHGKATPEHRAELSRKVGENVEGLVFDYEQCQWYQRECVREHLERLESYDARKRGLLLIRLANELEDYLDLGMAYRGAFPYREKIAAYGDEAAEVAKRLGHPGLAHELKALFDLQLNSQLPETVMTNERSSFQLPLLKWLKKSYLEKLRTRAGRLLHRSPFNEKQNSGSEVSQCRV